MNSHCPSCKQKFEKEDGYFIGAMLASYFLGIFLVTPTLVLSIFYFQMELVTALGLALAQLVILQPLLFRYSRIIWIQVEYRLTTAIHKP